MCLSRGVCYATLPSEVAADCSVGFVCFWLLLTLNSELWDEGTISPGPCGAAFAMGIGWRVAMGCLGVTEIGSRLSF